MIQKIVVTKENSSWSDVDECRINLKNEINDSDWGAEFINAKALLLPTSIDIDFNESTQTYTETRTWNDSEALSAYQSAISSINEDIENYLTQAGWVITETTVDS